MAKVFCVANQKGGVGKTTTSVNLGTGLAKAGFRTLVVDLDPQCNATSAMGHEPVGAHPLVSKEPIVDQVVETLTADLFLLPGCHAFHDISVLATANDESTKTLVSMIRKGTADFDFALIDCPPSIGQLTQAALSVSTEVIMPIQCEFFAMEGLTQMIHLIRRVMARPESRLEFGGILLTMYDDALELTREVDMEVRDFFGDVVFDAVIPRDVAVSEAPSHGQSVLDYRPRSRGSRAYTELCLEILDR